MSSQNPKRAMFEHLAAVARGLGSAHRIELLELLAQTERSVEELAGLSSLTIANASQHLQHLRRFGLVEARREGKRVIYRLADPRWSRYSAPSPGLRSAMSARLRRCS